VVPGSSPGGTTKLKTFLEEFQERFFNKKTEFYFYELNYWLHCQKIKALVCNVKLTMMNKLKRVVGLLMLLISTHFLYAAGPPNPGKKPPPPPSLPIDDYIGIMIVLSILYGFYVINYKLKTKTPR
jgi:hypothetical protein